MGQPALSLIQVFEKMLKTNKRVAFEGDLYRILESTIWVGLYYLLKIDENFVKGQCGSNRIVFNDFFGLLRFRKLGK